MKNRILPLIFAFLATTSLTAQVCGTYDGSLEEQQQKHPSFFQGLETLNAELEADYKSAVSKMKHLKVENGKRIIPVVVHVIHNFGNENISDASIQGALDALNKNINGQSDKFLNQPSGNPLTPDIFAARRGVANVEFRLAKLDPNGNPTTGILRVQSELTNKPENRNAVKRLSYWNSYQYFNIWTLKSFADQDEGFLAGFAQFPDRGAMSTDGVVLISSAMSDVQSTTLTHEAGHWLGLRHIWGDAECGDDGVKDTPTQKYSNGVGDNPGPFPSPATFPYHVGDGDGEGCLADSLNPAGEMFMNFMDYTNDNYVTMFSAGQVDRMNETLEGIYDEVTGISSVGYREYLSSATNIEATGTADGFVTPSCSQKADFGLLTGGASICDKENIVLKGNKTLFGNANINSMVWNFGDGNTDNSNNNSVSHTYNGVGSFDVSLTIVYNERLEVRSTDLSDLNNADSYDSIPETLIAQGTEAELNVMGATNIVLHLDVDSLSINSHFEHLPVDSLGKEHSSSFFGVDTFLLTFYTEFGGNITTEETNRLALCFNNWSLDSIIASQNTATLEWEYDTLTYYYGEYSSDAYDAYFMDTLFYRGQIEQTTYFAYYENTCTSTTVKENFISVNSLSPSNTAGDYTYSFEDENDLSSDWMVGTSTTDNDWDFNVNQSSSWERIEGVAVNGSASIMIDGGSLTLGSNELISVAYDLSTLTSPAIKFSYSGASANTFPVNELNVYYSNDCGNSWGVLGSLSKYQVANAGLYAVNFKPLTSEWNDTVMKKSALKSDNIKFKFEYVTSGVSNNFYLDNIQIGEESALFSPSESASKLSIYPNPTSGIAVIELENLAEMNVEVKLVNILGAEVMNLFEGEIVSNYYSIEGVDLSHLETGIYFVKVVANGNIVTTEKLILNK